EKLAYQLQVRARWIEMPLSVVGTDEETAGSTCGVQNHIVTLADAKRVDQINSVVAREVLAIAMTFFRTDQLLEDASDHVGGNLAKVDRLDATQQAAPGVEGPHGLEDKLGCPVLRFRHEERL